MNWIFKSSVVSNLSSEKMSSLRCPKTEQNFWGKITEYMFSQKETPPNLEKPIQEKNNWSTLLFDLLIIGQKILSENYLPTKLTQLVSHMQLFVLFRVRAQIICLMSVTVSVNIKGLNHLICTQCLSSMWLLGKWQVQNQDLRDNW